MSATHLKARTTSDAPADDAPAPSIPAIRDDSEPTESALQRWFRDSDRVGALPESKAALDVAFTRGYAQGVEQTREEALDALRTLVLRALEARFGEVGDATMDRIAESSWATLERWVLAFADGTSDERLLAGPETP